jgi:hypothetical protein
MQNRMCFDVRVDSSTESTTKISETEVCKQFPIRMIYVRTKMLYTKYDFCVKSMA